MRFAEEVEEAIGVRPDGWTFVGDDIAIWFAWTPSENKPEGQPLSWEQLDTLNERYNVQSVQSDSDTAWESRLRVTVADDR